MFSILRWEIYSAPLNLLAGFQEQLQGGGKRGERGRRERKENEGKRWEKHPQNKFLVTILPMRNNKFCCNAFTCMNCGCQPREADC